MKKRGKTRLSEAEAIFFLKQVALGFKELHRHKIMHRDFKVDNLFMNDATIVIADLGFAKMGQDFATTHCGSPAYMAPEIFEKKKYTNRTDLWSVGVTFYELLFGVMPFTGSSHTKLHDHIKTASGDRLDIPRHRNDISKECEEVLKGILTYDISKRMTWSQFFNHP